MSRAGLIRTSVDALGRPNPDFLRCPRCRQTLLRQIEIPIYIGRARSNPLRDVLRNIVEAPRDPRKGVRIGVRVLRLLHFYQPGVIASPRTLVGRPSSDRPARRDRRKCAGDIGVRDTRRRHTAYTCRSVRGTARIAGSCTRSAWRRRRTNTSLHRSAKCRWHRSTRSRCCARRR